MSAFLPQTSKPLSQRIFEKYDTDHSGDIDVAEFHTMLRDQGIYLGEEALALAVMELDRNGDSKISYEEFKGNQSIYSITHTCPLSIQLVTSINAMY